MKDLTIEKFLESSATVEYYLKKYDLPEGFIKDAYDHERQDKKRYTIVRRLYMRFSKLRRHREKKELNEIF